VHRRALEFYQQRTAGLQVEKLKDILPYKSHVPRY
jgi:hypothetical protein